jgi:hypothetical protein
MAAGINLTNTYQPQVSMYDGTNWSAPVNVDVLSGQLPEALSCASPSLCALSDDRGRVSVYDGTGWSAPVAFPSAQSNNVDVSCAAPSFCVAISLWQKSVITYDGTGWSAPVSIDNSGSDDGWPSVSCASPSFCVAISHFGNAVTYDGTNWSAPVSIGNPGTQMRDVSCPSPTFCTAISGAEAFTYDGTAWSIPSSIYNSDNGWLVRVSCATEGFCLATGSTGVVLTYDGTGWSPPTMIDPPYGLLALSCPSVSFCMAADSPLQSATSSPTVPAPSRISERASGALLSPRLAKRTTADLFIRRPLAITTASPPPGTLRVRYSTFLSATGGNSPYKWSISSGMLPPGLKLKKSTGAISGKPKIRGEYTFTVVVKDHVIRVKGYPSRQDSVAQQFTIDIS